MQLFGRRKALAPDKEALSKILAEETPPGAASMPLTLSFGRASLIGLALGLVIGPALFVFIDATSGDLRFAIIFTVALSLVHIAAIFGDPTLLDVSVTVSGEGIRQKRWFSEKLVPWWENPQVIATRDITRVTVQSQGRTVKVYLSRQTAEKRVEFVQAIRAWLHQYSSEIAEAPAASTFKQQATTLAISGVGIVLLFAGITFFAPSEQVLGIRCSVNSPSLQDRYQTPDRQGCVVLRVSAGAEKAGISQGDLLIEMNGVRITSGTQFTYVFNSLKPPYKMTVIRTSRDGSRILTFDVGTGKPREFPEDTQDPFFYYLRARGEAAEYPHQALIDYSRAVQIDPTLDLGWLYLAEIYGDEGSETQARDDFEFALEKLPKLGEAHMLYGYYLSTFDSEADQIGARVHAEEAIRLNQCDGSFEEWNVDCSASYALLALLQGRDQDFEGMARTGEQAIRFYPKFSNGYFYAACGEKAMGHSEEASSYAKQYLDFPIEERDPMTTVEMQAMVNSDAECNPFGFELDFS